MSKIRNNNQIGDLLKVNVDPKYEENQYALEINSLMKENVGFASK